MTGTETQHHRQSQHQENKSNSTDKERDLSLEPCRTHKQVKHDYFINYRVSAEGKEEDYAVIYVLTFLIHS